MRARWVIVAVVAVVAMFAIAIGGFLWPRPQFEEGRAPWTLQDDGAPAESLPPDTSLP